MQAAAGDGTLHLKWSDSSSEHDGYHVHYKRSTATDWVDAGHTGLERSMTITGLTNSVSYDARVRLTFDDDTGRWSDVVTATPEENVEEQGQSPTVSGSGDAPPEQEEAAQPTSVTLALGQTSVSESGGTVSVTATLDAPAPEGGIGGFLLADADGTASQGFKVSFTATPDIPSSFSTGVRNPPFNHGR